MSFTAAPAVPAPKPPGTGVSIGLSVSKRSSSVRITLTEATQKQVFGRSVRGCKCNVLIGRGPDEGRVRIILADDGFAQFSSGGIKGSCSVKVGVWDLLPKDKRPAASCSIDHYDSGGLLIGLPSWARPSKAGGKLEAEFGLRGVGSKK